VPCVEHFECFEGPEFSQQMQEHGLLAEELFDLCREAWALTLHDLVNYQVCSDNGGSPSLAAPHRAVPTTTRSGGAS
jgi:hypothetical protein